MIEVRILWGKLFSRRDTWQITPNDLERCFWEAEHERTQVFERTRRSQQLDFALAAAPWTKAEDTRHEIFQRFILEALKTFASNQDDRHAGFKELVDNHEKTFQANDQVRLAAFDDANTTRLKVFKATQEQREKSAAKFITFQDKLFEQGRRRKQEDCEKLIGLLRDLFNKMIREEIATFRNAQRQREERIRSASLVRHPLLDANTYSK
ncbi:hypothetical protein EUX98_g5742 [Antrodiella citrinella]|uniref:Uncharacterized protein n=1 Tax=Antrodiella citrinella TaxID=2447956 RepID=A0A4S4MRP6_9APHY|nr:hypothetical protein EUX98_g5742 [Antrodiella citrinella]